MTATSEPAGALEATTATSGRRELPADLVRAVAICAVVIGHWLVIAVTEADGELDGVNALVSLRWSHPLTWVFQVMPLFFLVGGYANATSMQRHRQEGGDALGWVVHRYRRLVAPSTVLLVTITAAVAATQALGADRATVATGAWVATVPLWFLAAYLGVLALAPATHAAHRRWGLVVPLAAVAAMALTDAARIGLGHPWIAEVNYLLAWAAVHQLGYSWHDGRLVGRPHVGIGLAAAGAAVLVALAVLGPYPVSMVTVPGAEIQNTEPPTLALVALAVTQTGVVLGLRDRTHQWLHGWRWRSVSRMQSVLLTLFLWHMAAAVVAAVVLHGTGIMAVPRVGSPAWLLLRIPWLLTCAVVLAAFVGLFGGVERVTRHERRGRRAAHGITAAAALVGIIGILVGILGIALAGPGVHGPLALPTEALVAYGVGTALLALSTVRSRVESVPRPGSRAPTRSRTRRRPGGKPGRRRRR